MSVSNGFADASGYEPGELCHKNKTLRICNAEGFNGNSPPVAACRLPDNVQTATLPARHPLVCSPHTTDPLIALNEQSSQETPF